MLIRYKIIRLFSPTLTPASPSTSLTTPLTRRRHAIPLDEIITLLIKSSRIALSSTEAKDSVKLLTELCPEFVTIKLIEKREWVVAGKLGLREVKEVIRLELLAA